MPKIYVLHHADSDGRFAGYCAWRKRAEAFPLEEMSFHEVQYNQPFPLDIDALQSTDQVVILDFSYDRETLDRVNAKVMSLLVLDHHESAEEQLRGAPYARYDMTKSGALLAWEYFYPDTLAPLLCVYTNDYDLWQHKYEESEAVEAWIQHMRLGQDWKRWHELCTDSRMMARAVAEGKVLVENNESIVTSFIRNPENIAFRDYLYGEDLKKAKIAVYNGNSILRNELASAIYRRHKVDATVQFRIKNNGVTFSLRSRDAKKFSVLEIARTYGGGGHPGSAGIALPLAAGMKVIDHFMNKLQAS